MPILLSQFNSPSSSPILCPYVHPLCLCLYFCPINRFICTIFLTSALCINTRCLFLSFWLHSIWQTLEAHPHHYKWSNFVPFYDWVIFHYIFVLAAFPPFMQKMCSFILAKRNETQYFSHILELCTVTRYIMLIKNTIKACIYLNTLQRNWLKKKPLIQIWFCQKFWWVYILNFPLCYLHIHFILIGSIRIFTSKSLRKTDALSFIKRLQSSSAFICCMF